MHYQSFSARTGRLVYKWRKHQPRRFKPSGSRPFPPIPAASPSATAPNQADTNQAARLHSGQI